MLLHAAFLTPDRCPVIRHETYTAINRSITKLVETAISARPGFRVVHFSSGAAAFVESNQAVGSAVTQLYGSLKLGEERSLQSIAPTLVLRIYALSGRYIREPHRYAFGDFIGQALLGKPIKIQRTRPVIPSYVHADCLAELVIRWLLSVLPALHKALNAVTHEVNLIDLARCVAAVFGGLCVRVPNQSSDHPSVYMANSDKFVVMTKLLCISVPTLEYQIRDTARADF